MKKQRSKRKGRASGQGSCVVEVYSGLTGDLLESRRFNTPEQGIVYGRPFAEEGDHVRMVNPEAGRTWSTAA